MRPAVIFPFGTALSHKTVSPCPFEPGHRLNQVTVCLESHQFHAGWGGGWAERFSAMERETEKFLKYYKELPRRQW